MIHDYKVFISLLPCLLIAGYSFNVITESMNVLKIGDYKDSLENLIDSSGFQQSDPIKIFKDHYIHQFSKDNKPCRTVESGNRLIFETRDALQGKAKEYYEKKTHRSVST